jgi:hypothetical protein
MKYGFVRDKTFTHLLSGAVAAAINKHTKGSTSLTEQAKLFDEAYKAYVTQEFNSDNNRIMPDSFENNLALSHMTCRSFLRKPSIILHLFKFRNRERDNLRALEAIKQHFINHEQVLIEAIQTSEYTADFKEFILEIDEEIDEEIVNDKPCIKFNCFS